MVHAICQGLIPISHDQCQKRPDEGVPPPLCAWAHHKNPVLHLPSQRPSDGLFSPMEVRTDHPSPCAPILWYLSVGHGPAHQRLRPPGAHQSKTSWQCESYLIIKIIKYMHNTSNKSFNSSKTLHKTHYTKSKQPKGQPIGLNTPQELESFRKGLFKPCIVTWCGFFRGCLVIVRPRAGVVCGCLCREASCTRHGCKFFQALIALSFFICIFCYKP